MELITTIQDLRFLGQATLGMSHRDTNDDVHPETIARYYESGAQSYSKLELARHVGTELDSQIKHDAVEVPPSHGPFTGETADLDRDIFLKTLTIVVEEGIIPAGYGMLPDEWVEERYPDIEVLRTRKRGGKEIRIMLDNPIWKKRAELWVQGLSVLSHCLDM